MTTKRTTVTFPIEEYEILKKLAKKENKSISEVIRKSVEKALSGEKASRFDNLMAFGIWAEDPRTDQEILNETGGNWSKFPLEE